MGRRPYNLETRLLQQAELKARIAQAAARLHKTQGALATSYAQIAVEAGVSVPTVYKHYPMLDDLIQACTSHVASLAPPFPQEDILAASDIAAAAEALVAASDATHEHFAPWLAWREQNRIAALAAIQGRRRDEMLALCEAVLERHLGPGDHRAAAAWWETLLSFETRDRMLAEHGQARPAFRRTLVHLLLAVTGPQPASPPSPRPKRKT